LKPEPMSPWILPVFIPQGGCMGRCVFCNQELLTGCSAGMPSESEFHAQIRSALMLPPKRRRSHAEIALYGGDFAGLPRSIQERLLRWCQPYLRDSSIQGIRASCRPDTLDGDGLGRMWAAGVSTIELGVQSFQDRVLRATKRGYTVSQVEEALRLTRNWGFRVGIHLMLGLPHETRQDWRKTLEETVRLRPDFVRIHPTIVLRDTPLASLFEAGEYRPLRLSETIEWCAESLLYLEENRVQVVRMGLQPVPALEAPGAVVAGPFHSALREEVESSLYKRMLRLAITHSGDWTVFVNPRDVSRALGSGGKNAAWVVNSVPGAKLKVAQDPSLPRGDLLAAVTGGKIRLFSRRDLAPSRTAWDQAASDELEHAYG
jgi:histone acetyltransferase (RNA polymerase elongator complex component)